MKIIIGLGNPGKEYAETRHNAGFLALDYLQQTFDTSPFQEEKKMFAEITSGMIEKEKVLLVKPLTFMNESGKSVRALLDFYKLFPSDIVVLHDDLDIVPGSYRTTLSSRAAGHNGVRDIIEKIGTQDFFRIRLGIGRPTEINGVCMPSHDFVLQMFPEKELKTLSGIFPKVKEEIINFISE